MGRAAYDSYNTIKSKCASITTNTRTNINTNSQEKSTQHIQANKVSTIVKNTKVEDKNIYHENNNSSLDNDNNTEVFNYTMYSLVNSSNYSSCYSNVFFSHSNSTSNLAYHDIPTHDNFEKLLLLAHNKQIFKTKRSKYVHTSI